MGASGAGKTSLLNIIADRISLKSGCRLTGELAFNDTMKITQKTFGSLGAYVMQDDILFEFFTVHQALQFAARLRLKEPRSVTDEKVEKLLKELGLWEVRNTVIGSALKKTISGGERKRTAIGVELITDP